MSKQEIKIVTKIIRELSHFLMLHGYKHFTLEMREDDDQTTYFIITVNDFKESVLEKMRLKITRDREIEVETYGWELIGDIDERTELEIVGLLIDDMEVVTTQSETKIIMTRKNKFRGK